MINSLIAVVLFLGILGILVKWFRYGNLTFWKLAAKLPDQAYEWFSNDSKWTISLTNEPAPRNDYIGPFRLYIPKLGKFVRFYAQEDIIEETQQRFIEHHKDLFPDRKFPYLSAIALLYPVAAMLWLSWVIIPAPPVIILGYGFSQLGYLLGVAFILPGHFWILGLDYRIQTIIAAVVFLVIGVVLSNFPT